MKRTYAVNDYYFTDSSSQSIYWAGFIAADGYLSKNGNCFSLSVAIKDIAHLEKFKENIEADNPIKKSIKRVENKEYIQCSISIYSQNNKLSLINKFNLKNNKSLTLEFPKNLNEEQIDLYIKGYIDGDGTILLSMSKTRKRKQKDLIISIIGTFEFLSFIKERFNTILNDSGGSLIRKRNNGKNTYTLRYSGAKARKIFEHFYKINCYCLERKWNIDYYTHCINFKDNYLADRMNSLKDFYENFYKDNSIVDCKKKYAIKKSKTYNLFLKNKLLNIGEEDLESQESEVN